MSEVKKESLEDIISAVTSKADVVMSLSDSKRKLRERAKDGENTNSAEAVVALLQIVKNKKFQKFIQVYSSPWLFMLYGFLSGALFLLGVIFTTYLLSLFDKTDILAEVLTVFTRLLRKF